MKSDNRLRAEQIMRDPRYWRDRDPDLHEQVHALFRNEPGGTDIVQKRPPPTMGGKGHPL
jgi:hypothetical protein